MQSAPATLTDADRAAKMKEIDTKEKRLNHDAEDAQTAYNTDLQEAYGKVAAKVSTTLKKYVSDNGYTLLLDVSSQQSNVMWANQSTDVTQAVVTAYNASSGVAAPVPSAPSAPAAARPRPRRRLRSQLHRSSSSGHAISARSGKRRLESPLPFWCCGRVSLTPELWKNLWIAGPVEVEERPVADFPSIGRPDIDCSNYL